MQHVRHARAHRILATLCLALIAATLLCGTAVAGEVECADDERKDLSDHSTTYVIRGDGSEHKSGNYFYVPKDSSSAENPLTIVLADVNRSQAGCDPSHSFITIAEGNYVIVRLRGTNTIVGGEQEGVGSNDGMAGIHVSQGAILKVTSDEGDGSTEGSLTAQGGGSKYGGAGIGSGGSTSAVTATVFHADVDTIKISGSTVTATGGKYAAGIGAGCGAGMDTTTADGKDVDHNIKVSDSTVTAQGGEGGAGIGGGMVGAYSRGGHSGDILLEGATSTMPARTIANISAARGMFARSLSSPRCYRFFAASSPMTETVPRSLSMPPHTTETTT
ncbi:MAG: hypothetical protein J6D54_05620 [Olsenella sp.]|nr:hypothetical protein [Olsenella sp.]